MTLIKGIDISALQGAVDFKALAASGIQFVICRCGIGNDGIDGNYAGYITAAKAAGLQVGAYHFVYPLPTVPGHESRASAAQAAVHFKAAQGVLPFCDLEWPEQADWAKWGIDAAFIVQWVTEYLQAYEKLSGQRPIVYTYPNFAQAVSLPISFGQTYKLWIASYESTPTIPAPWTDWVVWQDTGGTGPNAHHLPSGAPVDSDFAKDLSLWVSPVVPAPSPAPAPTPVVVPTPAPVIKPIPSTSFWQQIAVLISQLFGHKQ